MTTRLNFKPGQKGTGKRAETYGDRPVCARYRCDRESVKPSKTAEIIVEEDGWHPYLKSVPGRRNLQARTKNAGGRRKSKECPLWHTGMARLEGRIALDARENRQDKHKGI